jgi:hypothetical protein
MQGWSTTSNDAMAPLKFAALLSASGGLGGEGGPVNCDGFRGR